LVTNKAFAELSILHYWERWTSNKSAQWRDVHEGNTAFRGLSNDVYKRFDEVRNRIKKQCKSNKLKAMEEAILEYATDQHSRCTKRGRFGIQNGGPKLFNELADL
jgi:hypothetical protein